MSDTANLLAAQATAVAAALTASGFQLTDQEPATASEIIVASGTASILPAGHADIEGQVFDFDQARISYVDSAGALIDLTITLG